MGYIYGLRDPLTKCIRYVGQTVNNPNKRYSQHLHEADKDTNTAKRLWIKSLKKKGLVPELVILEECSDEELNARESYWIQDTIQLHPKGRGLLNLAQNPHKDDTFNSVYSGIKESVSREMLYLIKKGITFEIVFKLYEPELETIYYNLKQIYLPIRCQKGRQWKPAQESKLIRKTIALYIRSRGRGVRWERFKELLNGRSWEKDRAYNLIRYDNLMGLVLS